MINGDKTNLIKMNGQWSLLGNGDQNWNKNIIKSRRTNKLFVQMVYKLHLITPLLKINLSHVMELNSLLPGTVLDRSRKETRYIKVKKGRETSEAVFSHKIKHIERNIPIPINFPSTTMPPRTSHSSVQAGGRAQLQHVTSPIIPRTWTLLIMHCTQGPYLVAFPFVFSFF